MELEEAVHYNYADANGKVYCRKLHKIITIGDEDTSEIDCLQCPLFFGSLQGRGVECIWDDATGHSIHGASSPTKELLRVSQLIDKGILKKDI